MIPVNIHGMTTDENQEDYVILLNGKAPASDKWLPIQISSTEARNIAVQLNDLDPGRPLSHDLLAELTDALGGTVKGVRLETVSSNELHGRIEVLKPDTGEIVALETTPSDAWPCGQT